ncbi:PREDICTED: 39S ribosomal protein L42, mitochondrial [Nicrophorus vespilloides]|uniref:Large ribosomal subunit protein mL42 n=1 Tax=Nicrophorus vespilloides TaxID=110193 RepID=A0ABM1MPR1_NICVS|nr:PREDICTED: 39S ribosomal protein L42, mitochondrial [Nicrophorus vespilloides]
MATLRLCIPRIQNELFRRMASTEAHKVVVTNDESTFVAWHPKQDFPYECTKPLPEVECKDDENSVLKMQFTPELYSILNKKKPEEARLELMNITHTTKHRWFPRARDRKAKKTPMDRPYL